MKTAKILLLCLITNISFGQTGTATSPFTSITQAGTVTTSGTYYFNISGTTFSTFVDGSGWVMIAIDFGNGSGNLPQGTALTTAARGIFNTTVLSILAGIKVVRISTTSGIVDVTSRNATIISRITSNTTLHLGTPDNTINDSWIGTGSTSFTDDAVCAASHGTSLDQNIVYVCGRNTGFHWIPSASFQREMWSSGESPGTTSFRLWVHGDITVPIKLISFGATIINSNKVMLNWKTASEIDNDYFTIEHSKNGTDWEEVTRVAGAGNSSSEISYTAYDYKPYQELSYYRLKQTDIDGQFEYSATRKITNTSLNSVRLQIYPNPVEQKFVVEATKDELSAIRLYNAIGQDVTSKTNIHTVNNTYCIVEVVNLSPGYYFIKTKTQTHKLFKV